MCFFSGVFCPKGHHLCLWFGVGTTCCGQTRGCWGYSWQQGPALRMLVHGIRRCGVIRILAWLLWDCFFMLCRNSSQYFQCFGIFKVSRWYTSSGCRGGGSAVKGRGPSGRAPRCVADLVALFAKDAKLPWPRENKYLHIHVHSQNDLLSFEL